ncbi:type II secretion system protein GspL [Reinekea sp.]|jgi:general secretion pathway protein L|uniref:type II secretion system protein GspL n=1 Tax=Reinekea sp. TaxID=1970455 RepID=UPI003988D8C9
MSIQLSIYWQQAHDLSWYWADDDKQFHGALEELQDQVQQRNLANVATRLFLPTRWFTTFPLKIPKGNKRVSSQMIGFAAEEFLAQDIEDMHLVMIGKPHDGTVMVTATAKDPFFTVVQTLKARQLTVFEAYDAGQFVLPNQGTHDVELRVDNGKVTLRSGLISMEAHHQGFPQWFEHWLSQSTLEETISIIIYSADTDGPARHLVTSLESNGHQVQWVVQEPSDLATWHEAASSNKTLGNLITAGLRPNKGNNRIQYWLPVSIAALFVLVIWAVTSSLTSMKVNERANQTWAASETVFKQVFGSNKRIQRPLMVREMRGLAASLSTQQGQAESANALTLLNDLRSAEETLLLEDFRFNQSRNETNFTIASESNPDAFNHFEILKTTLIGKGYQVEYSASQDRDAVRAKFKSVKGG